ncbi:protein E6-like [Punica granatum]|uniref:Uncharacterized protein n=2 Tax=Punica granatum TaxID=22663 RepID=A0A218Y2U5_PUNGR|nr:protein E6-like [Punica granatum]OWM91196.1 hypothetical protein CDL15_Pgr000140 [Punica granatum]PKI55367.1 hypothetical protein CRG98_024218 [Punica granatum]
MASPSSSLSIAFFIALSITSLAHARESQFFSKATKETTTVHVPNSEQQKQQDETLTKQQVDEPNFIPQTTPNGYGLYGHETGQLPPSATTTTTEERLPYRTTTTTPTVPEESLYGKYEQNTDNYEQNKQINGKNNYYYNKESYVTDEERAAGLGNRYTTTSASLADRNNYYSGGNSYGNAKQEGMSDTRFMENGKYYYDIDNEEKYNPNYRSQNTRTTSRSSEYNPNMMNGGYYGNNYKNSNYKYNGNTMGGYEQNQEEFQDVQDEFVP